ncbi:hypothetical protein XENOCAPTIV_017147 [Xenoophorus captivus]|uniref:Uncharacterized protein n=1 Tax=Xenoophorus captivus TaxID=1517983 RepID=A0ABV0S559_9TELE
MTSVSAAGSTSWPFRAARGTGRLEYGLLTIMELSFYISVWKYSQVSSHSSAFLLDHRKAIQRQQKERKSRLHMQPFVSKAMLQVLATKWVKDKLVIHYNIFVFCL